jgi:UDP-glucose 4-epimerase
MERVGVTGASGFMGSVLLARLRGGHERHVTALTRTISSSPPAHDSRVEWMQGDLASYRDCARFVTGLDAIVHLAHANTPLTSNQDLPSDAAMNVVPTVTLLQAIRGAGTKPHVVFVSTGGALYRGDGRRPVDEESPVEPTTSYGIQKLMAEHYLRLGVQEGWITATVLRIGNPYGALLSPERRQGFVGVALAQLLERRPVRIFGDPDNVRDYVHLDDVMRIFELALPRRAGFEVYNVGSGEGRSVREVLELLQQFSGITADVQYEPLTADSRRLPSWIVLDIGKARRELGWQPEIGFTEGLRVMCEQALAVS